MREFLLHERFTTGQWRIMKMRGGQALGRIWYYNTLRGKGVRKLPDGSYEVVPLNKARRVFAIVVAKADSPTGFWHDDCESAICYHVCAVLLRLRLLRIESATSPTRAAHRRTLRGSPAENQPRPEEGNRRHKENTMEEQQPKTTRTLRKAKKSPAPAPYKPSARRRPPKPAFDAVMAHTVNLSKHPLVRGLHVEPDGRVSVAECSEEYASAVLNRFGAPRRRPTAVDTSSSEGEPEPAKPSLDPVKLVAVMMKFRGRRSHSDTFLAQLVPGWRKMGVAEREAWRREFVHTKDSAAFKAQLAGHGLTAVMSIKDPSNLRRSLYEVT